MRASGEYSDVKHPVHVLAVEHKKKLLQFFHDLAKEAGLETPKEFSLQVQLLVEGTIAMAQLTGDHGVTK